MMAERTWGMLGWRQRREGWEEVHSWRGTESWKGPLGGTVSAGQSPGGRLLEGGVRVWVAEEVGQAVWAQAQGRFCISN